MRGIVALLLFLFVFEASGELRVVGLDKELLQNVLLHTKLSDEPCNAESWLVRRRFGNLENEAKTALEPFGFYNPTFESELQINESCWTATLEVNPGEPVEFRDVEIAVTGDSTDDHEFVVSAPMPHSGETLRHTIYDDYKRALRVAAIDRGYFDAEFTESRLDVFPEDRAADVRLLFNSGLRYRIGEIDQEADFLYTRLIAGYTDLHTGEYYDNRAIARAHRDLSSSGYFANVEVRPDFENASDGVVPIQVRVEPARRIEYTVGAGFATDTGPRLKGGYRNHRINRAGHRLTSSLTASPVISGLTAEYRQPRRDPRTDWLSYAAALDVEDTETSESEAVRIGIRKTKRMNSTWLRTWSLDYSVDRFKVGDIEDTSRLLLPGFALDYKWADRDLYPDRGRRLTFEVRGSAEGLLSDASFLQFTARGRWVRALSDNSRLLARITIGTTVKDDFSDLPPSLRFFAGGDESIRGFDYNTLGPTDADGNVIGGSNLAVASLEYEHRIRGDFFAAAFVDGGNAFDDADVDAAYGAGLGVKWRSPVGPIRLYLAHPLNKSDRDVRVHLSLGMEL